jgi:hypothetical protein
VNATRECVSEQGKIQQRITVWEPAVRLAFHMESTDLGFHSSWITSATCSSCPRPQPRNLTLRPPAHGDSIHACSKA